MKLDFLTVKKEFDLKGIELLTTSEEFTNSKISLKYKCARCGRITTIKWVNIKQGRNKEFLCRSCQPNAKKTIEEVRKEFESKGAILLSDEYHNNSTPLYFLCSKCGSKHHILWINYTKGYNSNLLCKNCMPNLSPSIEYIRERFAEIGAKLLTENYVNNRTPMNFECSECGGVHHITWSDFVGNYNPKLLCRQCLIGEQVDPLKRNGGRSMLDNYWYKLVKGFFNISTSKAYSAHHIIPFGKDVDRRLSIVNGFPILSDMHYAGVIDENGEKHSFHYGSEYQNPENWSSLVRLPYHNYTNFRFLDLNSKVITDIYPQNSDVPANFFIDKKRFWSERGILFIPIYYDELFYPVKREIIFSIIRNKLGKDFKDVYNYTNTPFTTYNTRKLSLVESSYAGVCEFFDNNHIQGMCAGSVYLSLVFRDEVVASMIFGKHRITDSPYDYELIRFATKINSSVPGAGSKLFKFFTEKYHPESIISYCDIRFSDIDPGKTIYPKLGFIYEGYSKPNYRYLDPKINRTLSRQSFQKHKLSKKLDKFDPNLTESANMANNGYYKQYDCGNHRFIWRKS